MKMGGGWIVEVDIKKFFDTLDHGHLQAILRQRVRDGVLLRLIGPDDIAMIFWNKGDAKWALALLAMDVLESSACAKSCTATHMVWPTASTDQS